MAKRKFFLVLGMLITLAASMSLVRCGSGTSTATIDASANGMKF